MIRRRLSDTLRRQDWFTVLIELLVVAIGIVLGLQASAWADRQAALEDGPRILARLDTELADATLVRQALREPDLIQPGLLPTEAPDDVDGFVPTPTCRIEAMPNDARFLSLFSANVSTYNTYMIEGFRRPDAIFEQFRIALDEALDATGARPSAGDKS